MVNDEHIKEKYRSLTTGELLEIAKDPGELRVEVIPLLQAELFSRDKKEEALLLSEFLVTRSGSGHYVPEEDRSGIPLSNAELAAIIRARLDSGEPAESIKIDLKDKGIEMFDLLDKEAAFERDTSEYLASLKEEGMDESEVKERMNTVFDLTNAETDILNRKLKTRGNQNLIIGYAIVIIIGVLSLYSLVLTGSVTIGAVLLIAIGIWRIAEGYRLKK